MTHDPREALKAAIGHIEHMAAWITATKIDTYSFESLGEDMPWLREALTTSTPKGEPCAWADSQGLERPIDAEAMKMLRQNPTTEVYWSRFTIPLYISPPPTAGWNEAIEAAINVVKPWPGAEGLAQSEAEKAVENIRRELVVALDALRREAPASSGVVDIARLIAETGSRDADDLKDMAMVGHATMAAVEVVIESDGPFKDWSPAQCPSEIITDLFCALMDDSRPDAGGGVREALLPFAQIADEYDDREDDAFQIWKDCDQPRTRVTLGQCRKARAALSTPSDAVNESAEVKHG